MLLLLLEKQKAGQRTLWKFYPDYNSKPKMLLCHFGPPPFTDPRSACCGLRIQTETNLRLNLWLFSQMQFPGLSPFIKLTWFSVSSWFASWQPLLAPHRADIWGEKKNRERIRFPGLRTIHTAQKQSRELLNLHWFCCCNRCALSSESEKSFSILLRPFDLLDVEMTLEIIKVNWLTVPYNSYPSPSSHTLGN